MAVVPVWRLFAYMTGDDHRQNDERRILAEWQVNDALRWCVTRGYDHIYLSRDPKAVREFAKKHVDEVTHHLGDADGGGGYSEGSVA